MKINLNNLKLSPHQSKNLYFAEELDSEALESWRGRFKQPVVVDVVLAHDGIHLAVQGSVHAQVELDCSRCLKPVAYTVDTQISAWLVDEHKQEEFSQAEDDLIIYSDGVADLGPLVEELIVSEIPLNILCGEECQGLCAICGSDLNASICGCREDNIDPRWEKLKQLT
jgi:uncharacterized protein